MNYERIIFVFGSNMAGRHGKGAALHARQYWGAIYGQGHGLQGDSYALPTKDVDLKSLNWRQIESYLQAFLKFAQGHPKWLFLLTPVGTGLAGHSKEDLIESMVNMKIKRHPNVVLTNTWIA